MSAEETSRLAMSIAEKLQKMRELSKKKLSIKSRLEEVNAESGRLFEEINRIDEVIRSLKYEITECLDKDTSAATLSIVNGGGYDQ